MVARESRELDLVVFGATGFTGTEVVKQLSRLGVVSRWAVGGRRHEALDALAKAWNVPGGAIVADVSDEEALKRMARSTRLVLNAIGPYRFFGEAVVKACIEGGADYIDLCGEPEFMERMLLQYHDAAAEAGVVICHACAFDSVPADLGIWHCCQLFREAGGQCAHVEMFHSIEAPLGYSGHVTTFQAAVHGVGAARDLSKVRKQLEEKYGKIPKGSDILGPLPKHAGAWFWEPRLGRYAVPFIGSDASVVPSSRRTVANILKTSDAETWMPQFGIYFTIQSKWSLFKMAAAGGCFQFLATKGWGRNLFLRFPGFFTFGAFSEEGPSKEQMANNKWSGDLFAAGVVGGDRKELVLHAELHDPGYIGTSLLFVLVAQTILEDRGKFSARGGVFTPGAFFHLFQPSSILERLTANGVEFKVVRSDL
mmetsp:Transcript_27754/g.74159  ORF Transcript_27754/g.74159 Transcript_27754/m.74159 type:complete len:424 (+) Transcript_27754:102-1373(+)